MAPVRRTNEAVVGITAGQAMAELDRMILSAPSTAEAERRLRAGIGHAEERLEHLPEFWPGPRRRLLNAETILGNRPLGFDNIDDPSTNENGATDDSSNDEPHL